MRIRNLTFKQKLLFSHIGMVLVFVLISIVYWLIQFKIEQHNTVMERLSIYTEDTLSSYDDIIKSINSVLYLHINDTKIENLLQDSTKPLQERSQKLKDVAQTAAQSNDYIVSISYIQKNELLMSTNNSLDYIDISTIQDHLHGRDGIPYIADPVVEYSSDGSRKVIPIYKEMFGSSGKSLGIICLTLDAGTVFSHIDDNGSENLHMIILGENGTVIYKSNHRFLYSISPEEIEETLLSTTEYKGKEYLTKTTDQYSLWGSKESVSKWSFLICYNENNLIQNVGNNVLFFIVLSLISIGVMIFIAWFISSSFTKNVHLFTNAIKNSRDTPIPEKISETKLAHDEIGELILEYNKMIDRLTVSQRNEYISKIQSQNMQIKMLSYQINPHFLYNCLNLISSLAIIENVPRISNISKTMGEIFRYTLRHDDMVTLRDELEQLFNYIEIQKIRFHNNFDIDYDISPDILDIPCMKFILQPIVENSFTHGFTTSLKSYQPEGQQEKPRIDLVIYQENHIIRITCMDNGSGISEERLKQIRSDLYGNLNDKHESLGLWNIHQRISSYYGEEYGILVDSIENQYTRISLSYPEAAESDKETKLSVPVTGPVI